MKQKKPEQIKPVWLTVFSDIVTNLTLFFLCMFILQIVSSGQKVKAMEGVEENFGESKEKKTGEEKEEAEDTESEWVSLDTEYQSVKMKDIIRIRLPSDIIFDVGRANLSSQAKNLLDDYASILTTTDADIVVEGHTDNIPISGGSRYESNWELSMMRAYNVANLLTKRYNINPARVISVGYSHYQPLAPNDTPENRAKNRRVDIKAIRG
ncbi:MAG: OmpA/MotB family protein [Elusimicrobiota bacterium]